jgi:uncharacterized protein (TIGR02217 family)
VSTSPNALLLNHDLGESLGANDGDPFLVESGAETETQSVHVDVRETTVTLAADTVRAGSDSSSPDSLVLNHDTGAELGANDGDAIVLEGMTVAAASIGSFHDDARFPFELGRGISGGPSFKTVVQESADGGEFRISKWQRPKRHYNIATAVDTPDDFRKVMRFYRRMRGSHSGFRLHDPFDWSTHPNHMQEPNPDNQSHRQLIGAGDGATTSYQLCKRYRCGAGAWNAGNTVERVRPITRPTQPYDATGPTGDAHHVEAVFVDGALQSGGYSIIAAGGELLFDSAPAVGTQIEWCGTFAVPVRFDQDVDQGMLAEMRTTEYYGLDLTATEINDGEHFSDHKWMGGTQDRTISENYWISHGLGRLWRISATTTGLKVYLPLTTNLLDGGPHLTIYNSGSNAFAVHHPHGAFAACVSSIANADHATFYLKEDGVFMAVK